MPKFIEHRADLKNMAYLKSVAYLNTELADTKAAFVVNLRFYL